MTPSAVEAGLAALRTLSLQIGSIATISVVAAIIAHQSDVGHLPALVYAVIAGIRVVALVLIRYLPEQRGAW